MPRKVNKGQQAKRTEHYRQMLESTPQLCKSMVYNELYSKLQKDRRLDRFIAIVQHCSVCGYDISKTVETLCKSFPYYIDEKDLTVECFEEMLKSYNDISVAWGYGVLGDEISMIQVKNKALKIIEKTDSMEDIQIYQSLFGKNEVSSSEDKKTTVNFNLFKK